MKIDGLEWMDWLHKMRAEQESRRQEEGISLAEWLRRVNAEAVAIMAGIHEDASPSVVRDEPRPGSEA